MHKSSMYHSSRLLGAGAVVYWRPKNVGYVVYEICVWLVWIAMNGIDLAQTIQGFAFPPPVEQSAPLSSSRAPLSSSSRGSRGDDRGADFSTGGGKVGQNPLWSGQGRAKETLYGRSKRIQTILYGRSKRPVWSGQTPRSTDGQTRGGGLVVRGSRGDDRGAGFSRG